MARIALVEDDPMVRELVACVLGGRGHRVDAYERLQPALEVLSDDPPDLLVTDLMLPDGSGYELVARLRGALPAEQLPVLVLSGLDGESDVLRGFGAGANDYLTKPFSNGELLARCAVLLARAEGVRASRPVPDHDELPGGSSAFGRYRVLRTIGRGSYGVVYRALDLQCEREVALKVLSLLPGTQPECRLRFLRETYALSAVSSPHVARLYDFGASEGRLYFAMELVAGPTLDTVVIERGRVSEAEARALLRGLGEALAALEAAGLVHRDLKPSTVILRGGRFDDPVLVDFGLAKRPFDRALTDPAFIVGTPGYLAPECITGGQDPDTRSDLFALGLVVRYALSGEEAFPELQGLELLQQMSTVPVPLPLSITPGLRRLLRQLTQLDRARRVPSAGALLRELDGVGAISAA